MGHGCVRAFSRGDQAVRASLGRRLPRTCAPSNTATGQDIRMAEAILGNAEAYAAALTQ